MIVSFEAVAQGAVSPIAPALPPLRTAAPLLTPAAAPASSLSDLAALLSSCGSVSRVVPPVSGRRWLIQIQDVHGNRAAQTSAAEALEKIFSARLADLLVMEGQTRDLDPAQFRSAPDRESRDAAAAALFGDGRLSGGGYFLITRPELVPAVAPLEDESTYRANVEALRTALHRRAAFRAAVRSVQAEIDGLKKRHYNAEMYMIDVAVARYESGGLPLPSLLMLLRHRGRELDYVTSALLRANTLESLYNAAEVGSELKRLLGKLKERLSDADAAALFDAAYRFQKGTLDAATFVSALAGVTSRRGLSLNDYPNLAAHLERTLVSRSIDPEKLVAAVEDIQTNLPRRLAVTDEERDVAALSRRVRLLSKLADLSLSDADWAELATRRAPIACRDEAVRAAGARVAALETAMSAAKDFYRLAGRRNDSFDAHLAAAARRGTDRLVVVAGGFHSGRIAAAARRLGYGYAAVTPAMGDARGIDPMAALRDLAAAPDAVDAAFLPARQTLSPQPIPGGAHARVAAALIARATLAGRPDNIQWGRDQLGYLGARLIDVSPAASAGGVRMDVTIERNGVRETIGVDFKDSEVRFIEVMRPYMNLWLAVKRWLVRTYFGIFGVRIQGRALHSNAPVRVRVIPREAGTGIRVFRTDPETGKRVMIPFVLSYVARNRSRRTGIEDRGRDVETVEHLAAAMRLQDVWNADVYINGPEVPILDGSARLFIDALKPIANWSPRPAGLRIQEPVVFWRDDNTMAFMLPLRDDEGDSEYAFVGNYGNLQTQPVEFLHTLREDDYGATQAAVGSYPTFVEKNDEGLRALQAEGFFRGAKPYPFEEVGNPNRARTGAMPSVVYVGNPADWANGNVNREGLARHKVMDILGDGMLLLQSMGQNVLGHTYTFGTGHRDTVELMLMVESGYRFPFQYEHVAGNLKRLLDANKMSRGLYDHMMERIAPYRDYDDRAFDEDSRDTAVSPADVTRLEASLRWTGSNDALREGLLPRIRDYLFRAGASGLTLVADKIATPQFLPGQIDHIEARVEEETESAIICEVTFVRPDVSQHDYPRVSIVIAKPGYDDAVSRLFYNMKTSSERMPPLDSGAALSHRSGDRRVNYIPSVGPLKSGVFARQRLRGFARVTPSRVVDANTNLDKPMPFVLTWGTPTEPQEQTVPNELRRKEIAKAVGRMLTVGFLRLRAARPAPPGRPATVPLTGQLIEDIDLRSDLLFDPIDGRAALANVRSAHSAPVEQFLYKLLQLRYRVTSSRTVIDQSRIMASKEWQPFAEDVPSVLAGVEAALIAEYGPELGRQGAIIWFQRYLDSINDAAGPLGDAAELAGQTWAYRHVAWSPPDEAQRVITSFPGQSIAAALRLRVEVLNQELARQTSYGVIRSLARSLAWLTGYPERIWYRLAPFTEQGLFSVFGVIITHVFTADGPRLLPSQRLAAFGIAFLFWIALHTQVLTRGIDGSFRWVGQRSLSWRQRARLAGVGLLVIAAPIIGFGGNPMAGIGLTALAIIVHAAANRSLTPEREMKDLLDDPQRAVRTLESAV